ncbi:MAG TPA: universal stress protein [Actinomycetes bacterium]|jgi:nucleotide-binding universal stress UspA family protein|nr:universal stress protein [Actinomycetes bacterium]
MSSNNATGPRAVVVGVDGSEASKDALRWALGYARQTGAEVHALSAWQYPPSFAWAPAILDQIDLEGDARRMLKGTVEEVAGAYQDVVVRSVVVEGPPALMLAKAAEHAQVLVVGNRGHGAFAGMLLGSVSTHCVHHASCPVVVVRHHHRERSAA